MKPDELAQKSSIKSNGNIAPDTVLLLAKPASQTGKSKWFFPILFIGGFFVVIFLLFGAGLYFSFAIPYDNKIRNEGGGIVKITYHKYIKIVIMMVTYLLFIWFLNALAGLSNNYVSLNFYYDFFHTNTLIL